MEPSQTTLAGILSELQALNTTEVEALQSAIQQTITDLTAFIAANPEPAPATNPITTITVAFADASTEVFVPQPADTDVEPAQ
jgi:hypothetical protein